ncbi:MAG: VOC family protein [Enterobacterales bacterium]|nr:VOC family protein [Enterobacterales bacterium]
MNQDKANLSEDKNNEPNKPLIDSIGQIAICITDLEQSLHFYQHILGFDLLFEVPPNMAFLQCGNIRLMLTTQQGEAQDHHTSVIYYRVSDLNKAVAALKQKGVAFIREPQLTAKMPDHELWQGFIRDPDENLIGIMTEKQLQG